MKNVSTVLIIVAILLFAAGCNEKNEELVLDQSVPHPVESLFWQGIEAFNAHDINTIMQQFAEDCEISSNGVWYRGLTSIRTNYSVLFKQLPNVKMEIQELQVREVVPGTAVIGFEWSMTPREGAPIFNGIGTGVYVKRGDAWVEVLEHNSVMMPMR